MKTIKIFIACLFVSTYVFAQENVPPYTLSDRNNDPPEFTAVENTNHQKSLEQFIDENFKPRSNNGWSEEGTAVVKFVIGPSGQVSDFKIINGVSFYINQEIIRVLRKTNHMWTPGYTNGFPVAIQKEITIEINPNGTNFQQVARNYFTKGAKKFLVEGKTQAASKCFAKAIRYNPNDKGLLFMNALCMSEMGDVESVKQAVSRIEELGGIDNRSITIAENVKERESYAQINAMLSTNE
ncbi:energy transducer TonB [Prolixibacteraceae bacterium Z1-6]|uniref:Energy transducer TonB n=1 Tax=Draconibacterium aestuarii TaxID=2998507 RepID=A0A9X3F6L4_9BACT|nr:energy transducer TonB [Prolixibacteraceae bacterium Z1-6]